ncbi:MAG: M48 family metallopeptidase [Rhodospirillales bacterium]|jgi:hypothetical protein|nr:M48 family metallopeptidase [Rhodospirillales bacterium]
MARTVSRPRPAPAATLRIPVGERELALVIRRHRRARRVILRLDRGGEAAVVTLPPLVPETEAIALALRSSDWLRTRLATLPPHVPFAVGAELPLLGRPHRVIAAPAAKRIVAADATIAVPTTSGDVSQQLHRWLRRQARAEIGHRVAAKATQIGRPVGRIAVRDQTSRWGSCAANGNLSFSWRLIMAPAAVLDYVVAHEVAHLAVKGHGRAFWALVRTLTTGVDEARAWLRCHGDSLHRYG